MNKICKENKLKNTLRGKTKVICSLSINRLWRNNA